jgi:hypothetical protein
MQWPWVSRKKMLAAIASSIAWHHRTVDAEARVQAYQKALAMEEERRRDEQWRRIKPGFE